MKIFRKLLVANRGEIAVRIMRSAREMGVKTVAVYAAADRDSLHIDMADEAYRLGESDLSETYLNTEKLINIAKRSGCDAIHPGYGFLSENAGFAEAVRDAGIEFVGPSPEAIHLMGNKIEARKKMKSIDVPLLEGITGTPEELLKGREKMEFPVLVKAAAGGGGKGMRIVRTPEKLKEALEATAREAKSYFGDDAVYIERYLDNPRHIEIQVMGDKHQNIVHLYERECSLQRRYQKIIEESPSVTLNQATRRRMGETAVKIAHSIGYYNAGTIEFLVDKDLNFYFLEMNTRIQVEHPVTEMVTGIDLVKEQLLVAAGNKLSFRQKDIQQTGHAIEARIYAEDPANDFMPSPGKMSLYEEPHGTHIRVDSGITSNTEIKPFYDPMISKLIVHADSREQARGKMLWALDNYHIHGIKNNINYLKALAASEDFEKNRISTKYCDEETPRIIDKQNKEKERIAHPVPLLAYLLKELRDISGDNIWRKIGLWGEVLEIPVIRNEELFRVEISRTASRDYLVHADGKQYAVRFYNRDKHKVTFCYENTYEVVFFSEKKLITTIDYQGYHYHFSRADLLDETAAYDDMAQVSSEEGNLVVSPMHGKLIQLPVKEGDTVKKGDTLAIVEAMKMENVVAASSDSVIKEVKVTEGSQVSSNQIMMLLEDK
ncbi:MAG: acetyl/propionyl/methylcrotonyl-CoA carboxylase subunit alpha [Bacteroidota bacterium]